MMVTLSMNVHITAFPTFHTLRKCVYGGKGCDIDSDIDNVKIISYIISYKSYKYTV